MLIPCDKGSNPIGDKQYFVNTKWIVETENYWDDWVAIRFVNCGDLVLRVFDSITLRRGLDFTTTRCKREQQHLAECEAALQDVIMSTLTENQQSLLSECLYFSYVPMGHVDYYAPVSSENRGFFSLKGLTCVGLKNVVVNPFNTVLPHAAMQKLVNVCGDLFCNYPQIRPRCI